MPSAIPINPLARVLTGRATQTSNQPGTPPSGSSLSNALAPQPVRQSESRSSLQAVPPPSSQPADYTLSDSGAETISELDSQLRKSTDAVRTSLAEVAYCIYWICEKSDWGSLGATSEYEYATGLGYTESSWGSYRLLGERLSSLTLDMMRQIPATSNKLLTTINAKLWPEYAWIEEARVLPAKDFALLVRERVKKSTKSGLEEPKTSLAVQVPALRKDEFERRIDSLRRREQLGSYAEVLDFALRSAEKDPARVGVVEKLDQDVAELERTWDGVSVQLGGEEAESLLAAKSHARGLLRQIQKSLKELKRYAPKQTGLPSEVAGDKYSSGPYPAQA